MCCCKWGLEWQLTTTVFDLVAVDGVGIIASGAEIFAKKAKTNCAALNVSKNEKKHLRSSWGKDLVKLGNGKRRLTK